MLGWAEITRPIVGRTAQTLAKSGCSTNAVVGKSGNKSGSKWDEPAATECSHHFFLKQGRGFETVFASQHGSLIKSPVNMFRLSLNERNRGEVYLNKT